jgi:hypothetical protein
MCVGLRAVCGLLPVVGENGLDLLDAAIITLGNTTGRMKTTDEPGTHCTY